MISPFPWRWAVGVAAAMALGAGDLAADLKTWDGRHDIGKIEVTAVYFVPRDRTPLPDWRERVDYFCRRIEKFHHREFQGQSTLTTKVVAEPFRSARTTEELRAGDGDFIFFRTLREVDAALRFGQGERTAYPILLVLSDINWRALEDFYRLRRDGDRLEFEGQLIRGRHFPGAASGGARATYLADRGVGWGLVSADGWRVPYSGTDCVVYHEGVGHPIGLPHPQPGNDSVMSLAQYRGWISESWLDDDQKQRLGWRPADRPVDREGDLFSAFRALPQPLTPRPGEEVLLQFDWPREARIASCRTRIQTALFGPWIDVAAAPPGPAPAHVALGRFDRPTPVSYRVDVELEDGQTEELWGYFQVRNSPRQVPLPAGSEHDAIPQNASASAASGEVDLLALIDPARDAVAGEWTLNDGRLEASRTPGARLEIPYRPPAEYRLTVIVEPLDEPRGLVLGQRLAERRFLALLNYPRRDAAYSALEHVDGQDISRNATATPGAVLQRGRLSQIICTVQKDAVRVAVDGRDVIHWQGDPSRLSLSDYWKTPHDDTLFLGAFDTSMRFYRATLVAISGEGTRLDEPRAE